MNKVQKKIAFAVEILWLVVIATGIGAGIYQTYTEGFKKSWPFFLIVVVGLAMYNYRRNLRKLRNKREAEAEGKAEE